MFIYNNAYNSHYKGYAVMANETLALSNQIMDQLINHIETYTRNYSRAFVVFFGLNFPAHIAYPTDNFPMIMFMDRFTKHLEGKKLRPSYVWVREQNTGINHHYHCMLITDGRRIQNKFGIMAEAERIWGDVINHEAQGLVHYQWDAIMLRTDTPCYQDDIRESVYLSSYLAKKHTKEMIPPRIRRYGYSALANA